MAEFEARARELSAADYDRWLIVCHLLDRGMNVHLLPGGVAFTNSEAGKGMAFLGMSSASTTSFGGMAMSRRVTSAWPLLEEAGLPVPLWRAFKATAAKTAGRFAEEAGYPVVVTTEKGERFWAVESQDQLRSAMERIQAGPKPHKTIIRKKLTGGTMRFLLLEDRPLLVMAQQPDAAPALLRDEDISPGLLRLAQQALRAVPGIELGEVLMELDVQNPSATKNDIQVVQVNPAPSLRVYGKEETASHQYAVRAVVEHHAEEEGISLPALQSVDMVRLECSGLIVPEEFYENVSTAAAALGCDLALEDVPAEESLSMTSAGAAEASALLASTALTGVGSKKHKAHMVSVSPV
ncbi:hypothetical protein [Nesterenkonia alba]|uniref:hypothetical protein n=1 Tax=Nesterenkonia alba TaxID=515814 RepID=UPI0012EBA30A|nr:hypothetical protein [Nesterenkonia alba]